MGCRITSIMLLFNLELGAWGKLDKKPVCWRKKARGFCLLDASEVWVGREMKTLLKVQGLMS